jgi:hypothetical protein
MPAADDLKMATPLPRSEVKLVDTFERDSMSSRADIR